MTKPCTKCGRELPATAEYFGPLAKTPTGLQYQCRDCRNAWQREYRQRDGGRHLAEVLAYQKSNPGVNRRATKKYHDAHPEVSATSTRNYVARKRTAQGSHTPDDVAAQYKRQRGKCYWCGTKVGSEYHVDHVIPLVQGGSNGPENLVISCPLCNVSKGGRLPQEFGNRLC